MGGNSRSGDGGEVVALRPDTAPYTTAAGAASALTAEWKAAAVAGTVAAAGRALADVERHLDRAALSAHTVRAYRRACRAFTAWLADQGGAELHPDAFADVIGADAAVSAWRRSRLDARASVATVNQERAAVALMCELAGLRLGVKALRVAPPGEPDALSERQAGAVERAAARRGARDRAIVAVLLYSGARVEECARLRVEDVAVTARTGTVRLHGKRDQVRTVPIPAPARAALLDYLAERGRKDGPLWAGQRGPLTISGITQVVLAVGEDAGVADLRPHRLRHTYGTRLRRDGADPAQVQYLLGHADLKTAGRYFRAGQREVAELVERAFP
ncbi:tyrosine-type recombinase/integrase [Actinomadura mexicana]|uniref:Integrase/recombinase XerC/integrase/recombinase XerD n=1 Tax=Actinomadura mexicana TaxID=134959 RepID=A0A239HIS7_9ACTN|nr:tyrosine-type recombinase/integrase [Actinomadura mexicana]SNS81055.1 integrase/recombinase XerC/integrase/recombinase XerD [Actinomadura mexicana]